MLSVFGRPKSAGCVNLSAIVRSRVEARLSRLARAKALPGRAITSQCPALWPPSMCRVSPVTKVAASRYRIPRRCRPANPSAPADAWRPARPCVVVGMHRSGDMAGGDGIDADSVVRVLNCQRSGDRCQASLGQRGQPGGDPRVWLFDQPGRHVDHVPTFALGEHSGDRALRDVEKAGQIHCSDELVVRHGVLGERLGDEDAGVVDQRVHPCRTAPPPSAQCGRRSRVRRCRPRPRPRPGSSEGVIEREFATTA